MHLLRVKKYFIHYNVAFYYPSCKRLLERFESTYWGSILMKSSDRYKAFCAKHYYSIAAQIFGFTMFVSIGLYITVGFIMPEWGEIHLSFLHTSFRSLFLDVMVISLLLFGISVKVQKKKVTGEWL